MSKRAATRRAAGRGARAAGHGALYAYMFTAGAYHGAINRERKRKHPGERQRTLHAGPRSLR